MACLEGHGYTISKGNTRNDLENITTYSKQKTKIIIYRAETPASINKPLQEEKLKTGYLKRLLLTICE